MSHTLLILKIYTTFKDVQMILKHFFDISTGFRYKKMEKSSPSIYRDVNGLSHLKKYSKNKVEMENSPEHFSTSIAVVGYMFMLDFHMGCQRWRTWIIFATMFTLQNFQRFIDLKSSFFDFLTQMQSFDMIFHVPTIVKGFTTVWT